MIILDKLKNLHELAQRGVGGEASNAQQLLHKMLKKHNLTIDDIKGEAKKSYTIKYKKGFHEAFVVCVLLKYEADFDFCMMQKGTIYLRSTVEQFILIDATIDVLWNHYKSELEYFEVAFIHKHGLGIKPDKENMDKNPLDTTKLLDYMGSIEQKTLHKQITNSFFFSNF
jgi:hypothetical protein